MSFNLPWEGEQKHLKKIVISGYYGFNNGGDEAILESLIKTIKELSAKLNTGIDITVLSNDPEATYAKHGVKSIYRFNPFMMVKYILASDILISGGGSLIQDMTSTRSLFYYIFIIELAHFFRKKIYIYANGVGPIRRSISAKLTKNAFGKADIITLRDKDSYELLKKIGVKSPRMYVSLDPVFTLDYISSATAADLLKKEGIEAEDFITVSVRNWENRENFTAHMAKLLDYISENYGRRIVFINMRHPKDVATSKLIAGKMRSVSNILSSSYTPSELIGIISLSKYCLSMRLHGLIFAAKAGVPGMALSYDPKINSFAEEFGMPVCSDTENLDYNKARATIDEFESRLEHYKNLIYTNAERTHERKLLNAELLEKLLKDEITK